MQALALAVTTLLLATAAPPEGGDRAPDRPDALRVHRADPAERLRLAEPLARTLRQVIDGTLGDDDRALIRGFQAGAVAAEALDARLWPKLRHVLASFNAADCRHLGGVAAVDEPADALTALRGGRGLHTSVVVTCARRVPGLAARRHLGLRVRRDDAGPTLVLHGFVETGRGCRVAIHVPLGDRAAERAALDAALAALAAGEADVTGEAPLDCRERPRVTAALRGTAR
jgi:hypothetical protein